MDQIQTPQPSGGSNLFPTKLFKWGAFGVCALIILLGAFALGVRVGFHEARFTENWEQQYPANFGGLSGPPIKRSPRDPFFAAHGVQGAILSLGQNTIIIKGGDNSEQTVDIAADTSIRQNFTDLKFGDLKVGESVIVIGQPNEQGQIEAKFIRVLNQP